MGLREFAFFAVIAPAAAFGSLTGVGAQERCAQDVQERMFRDLDTIRNTFEVKYAPADWKKRYANWDLATEIELAKERVRNSDDSSMKAYLKAYQRSVRQFFQSTKDYHVGVSFWSTEWAALPFRVCGANGKYYITYIDRARLPSRSFSFQIGDELVMFDGRPTDDIVQEVREREVGNTSPNTDQGLAEIYLTTRAARQGLIVPRGPVTIGVRSMKTNSVSSYQIIWDYSPEKIKELPFKSLDIKQFFVKAPLSEHSFFKRQMKFPFADADEYKYIEAACLDPNELGERESFIPPLGKLLWQSSDKQHFHAYLFETPTSRRKIGYVRIPNYSGGAFEVEAFGEIIAYLQEHSEALVIDQVNNPGGSVFYLYGLACMLTDQPLFTPKHRTTITQQDVAFALEYEKLFASVKSDDDARSVLGDSMEGYPVNYQTSQFMLNFFRFIVEEWNDGRTLTKPYYLYGVDCINRHPEIRYTKPILLLVNRLCFSGGDFLPAILQDNKRVTIFGSKTAGAGGYVDGFSYPNPFGVAFFHYTGSIAERIDNNPIENIGITPDIPYEITEQDLQNNFSGYVQAVLDAVENL